MNKPPIPRRGRSRSARGFGLIESLVALVLFAVGLVGLIGLKLATTMHIANANAHASATVHAGDILDRLRANPVRALAGEYTMELGDPAPAAPATIAEVDLAQWRSALASHFPEGNGSVAVAADGEVTVVLSWRQRDNQNAAGRPVSFTFRSRL